MPENEAEFLQRLLATFKVEAGEHVSALVSGLLELENASPGDRPSIIETIFRGAHSLKGAARSVNLTEIESICARLENAFAALKRKEIDLSADLLDTLHEDVAALQRSLSAIDATTASQTKEQQPPSASPSRKMIGNEALRSPPTAPPIPQSAVPPHDVRDEKASDTIRVSTARLDALLRQAEELLSAKLAAAQHARAFGAVSSSFAVWHRQSAIIHREIRTLRPQAGQDDGALKRLLDFVDWNDAFLRSLEEGFTGFQKDFERDRRSLAGMVDTFLNDLKEAAMLPFSSVLDLLRKLVRDLSREQVKPIDFIVHGADLEMDRRVLEALKDPLIHLVRNSVDHGIEAAEQRAHSNKPIRGTITVSAFRTNGRVEILVADDGAGIDLSKVKASAVDAGILSPSDANSLSDAESASLVFRSGVSTSPAVTDISGRGLGLAIVQEKVERLGGTVRIESQRQAGTTFHLLVPLTLSTFRGVVIKSAKQLFVWPTTHIERVIRFRQEDIRTIENRETLSLNGQVIPLLSLAELLGISNFKSDAAAKTAIIIDSAGQCIAFEVDELLQEQELMLKNLGKQLVRVRHIAGATILGDGVVVPVLNVTDLAKSAFRTALTSPRPVPVPDQKSASAVLVVDDSITSRTLLKNILETNGYKVETAIDGIDAYARLRSGNFKLVISDVEMPRLNGFDLTARIRADKHLTDLPVILVTALESREDRERGVDVGASAYIVKRSFDQSDLLAAINRLI